MKKCPKCNHTYSDETLSFCLDDGALLSVSSALPETIAPTAAFNAGEVPTIVNSFSPTQQSQTEGVGWTNYLIGLFISLIVEVVYSYYLYPYYAGAMQWLAGDIAANFDDYLIGHTVANFIIATPMNTFVYALLAFVLGFAWSRGKWKWGVIALIPNFVIITYYLVINVFNGLGSPFYYIRLLISNIVYLIATCLFAYIGSRLSSRIFSKQ